ncbi:MAG: hypothetical protein ACM36C_10675, partial [Acidobacteriota bacterium]
AGVEAIAEVFNLFNAKNPAGFERGAAIPQSQRLVDGQPNPEFMAPSFFAGDFRQPEQRVGQIGFRITF